MYVVSINLWIPTGTGINLIGWILTCEHMDELWMKLGLKIQIVHL